ncbi:hypothetical protein IW492_05410 [Enterococcus sp. BWB1-3]|uniref:hypothetical protein n=1 Tax=Enterococcus sp. BWB1-3 TaxID=2787713 RepID=UPI001920B9F4|nr:hypothetical protein [Enterococcus sp. BWB1-3]MBL1228671.1 hypothetical protein [Enterococcus sp. BWB1-3]MCB5952742.1 hypothetical protein [Enterococcus sp. BWT-B8]
MFSKLPTGIIASLPEKQLGLFTVSKLTTLTAELNKLPRQLLLSNAAACHPGTASVPKQLWTSGNYHMLSLSFFH